MPLFEFFKEIDSEITIACSFYNDKKNKRHSINFFAETSFLWHGQRHTIQESNTLLLDADFRIIGCYCNTYDGRSYVDAARLLFKYRDLRIIGDRKKQLRVPDSVMVRVIKPGGIEMILQVPAEFVPHKLRMCMQDCINVQKIFRDTFNCSYDLSIMQHKRDYTEWLRPVSIANAGIVIPARAVGDCIFVFQ